MRLTPLDIRKQEFKKAMRGLDSDEVLAFLSTIADEYEAVINDNKALRERLLELDDKVQEYRNMEKTLRDTLLTAERVTVDAKENARREADLIVKEAQIEADKAVRDIRNTATKLRQDIQMLKQQKESYLARLKVLVESQVKFVETAENDFAEEEHRLETEQQELEARKQTAGRPEPSSSEFKEILDQVIEHQKDALKIEVQTPESAERAPSRDTVPQPPQTGSAAPPQPVAAAVQGDGKSDPKKPGWSLDRLRQDILTGSTKEDETG